MKNTLPVIISLIVSVIMITIPAYGDIISPLKQTTLGISSEDVICEDGLFKIFKMIDQKPACVRPETAERLSSTGWAKAVDQNSLEQFKQGSKNAGTVKKLSVLPQATDVGKVKTITPVSGYSYVFEVCANTVTIYAPEVVIKSDSETKVIELAENAKANSCIIGATSIKAANPDLITIELHNRSDISNKISELETLVSNLRMELSKERENLGKQMSGSSSKIIELRKQVNDAREDLNRYFFAVYSKPTMDISKTKFTYSGAPIEGEIVNKLSAQKSLSGETYDVAFEACAGKQIVRFPVIIVSSDRESQTIKLGDKISPESCQKSAAKIMADDPESIVIEPANNAEQSNKIVELETTIADLQSKLAEEKKTLNGLVHDPTQPADRNERVTKITANIENLREQINSARADLYSLLYFSLR